MSNTEDLLYEAYNEGILNEVYDVLDEMKDDDKWKHREFSDKISSALDIARKRKARDNTDEN